MHQPKQGQACYPEGAKVSANATPHKGLWLALCGAKTLRPFRVSGEAVAAVRRQARALREGAGQCDDPSVRCSIGQARKKVTIVLEK